MTVYEVIKKNIDKLDYMGLLKMGAPNDEYDIESHMILERINPYSTANGIAMVMCDVFSSMFGRKFDCFEFVSCARDIYIELKIENLIN